MRTHDLEIDRDAREEKRLAEAHRRGMEEIKDGKGIRVSMETLEKMANGDKTVVLSR